MRFLWVMPLVAACGTYNYNRAALVPKATPRMTSGQPLEGRGQLSVGASSVSHLGDPKVGEENNGVELPGTQLFAGMKARIGKHASFGFLYENGLDAGAKKLNSSQPDVDNGNVQGYGVQIDVSIPIDGQWSVGFGVDAMLWKCPYVSYETFMDGSITIREQGSDTVDTFAASMTPSYKMDKVTLFGGITVRNHPTIQQKGTGMGTFLDDVEVESGPANYIVSAGVEAALADGAVLLSAVGYYDVSRDPAKYGPGAGLMLSLPLGRRSIAPPQQQPPPGYAPPGYQPYPPAQPYPPQPYPPAQPYPPPQPYPPTQPYPPPQPTAPEPPPAPPT